MAAHETLSSVDTTWFRMEDAADPVDIGALLIFEGPLELSRLREVVEARLLRWRRFRQRVVTPPLGPPQWEDDPRFTLDAHLHRHAVPAPGDQGALEDLVGDLMSARLDLERPLWQLHLIDQGGRSALLARVHHCLGDGFALAHLLLQLGDATPDAPLTPPPAHEVSGADEEGGLWSALSAEVAETLAHPGRALDLARQGAAAAAALGHLVLLSPDSDTVLRRPLQGIRRAAWSQSLPLARIKEAARATSATVNDLLMTALTGALRAYLHERGEAVDDLTLRAIVPVNLRPARWIEEMPDSLGNRFGLVFLDLPVDAGAPPERLRRLKQDMDRIKGTPEALVAFELLVALGRTPATIQHLVEDVFVKKGSVVVTNVPGPRRPLYLAGVRLSDLVIWVPHPARLGLGLSIVSYDGQVRMGVRGDVAVADDPRRVVDLFEEELRSLGVG